MKSNRGGDFYCLNCFHSYRTKEKLKKNEKLWWRQQNHDYCYAEIPDEDNKILKYNHGENSLKAPFIIYEDLERLLEKMHSCQNNLEKSYTLFLWCIKNKLDGYRGKDIMERFFKGLRRHAMKVVNYERKKGHR